MANLWELALSKVVGNYITKAHKHYHCDHLSKYTELNSESWMPFRIIKVPIFDIIS